MSVMSREAKRLHVHVSSGLCDHYNELFTWMVALNFKCCISATITAIT